MACCEAEGMARSGEIWINQKYSSVIGRFRLLRLRIVPRYFLADNERPWQSAMGTFQGLEAFNVGVILGWGDGAGDIDGVKTSGTLALGRLLSGAVNHVRNSIAISVVKYHV